jgi:hypothetical protein
MAVLTVGVYAKGDWKRKRLVDPDSLKRGQLTTEIIAEEGVRA